MENTNATILPSAAITIDTSSPFSLSSSLLPSYTYLHPYLPFTIHDFTITVFIGTLLFYNTVSYGLQYYYYYYRAATYHEWKLQIKQGTDALNDPVPWIPFFGHHKPRSAPYHQILTTLNTTVAAIFAALTTEYTLRGRNYLYYQHLPFADKESILSYSVSNPVDQGMYTLLYCVSTIGYLFFEFLVAVIWENIAEYYWHRCMHTPFMYQRFHKLHHRYRSPMPFDDMYIHPLEAIGYYMILYSPPFLGSIHLYAFLGYMALMGITGICDHSGIRIKLFWNIYSTEDHDLHHERFDCNLGFPFPWLDILHGTYRGTFWGKQYNGKAPPSIPGYTDNAVVLGDKEKEEVIKGKSNETNPSSFIKTESKEEDAKNYDTSPSLMMMNRMTIKKKQIRQRSVSRNRRS